MFYLQGLGVRKSSGLVSPTCFPYRLHVVVVSFLVNDATTFFLSFSPKDVLFIFIPGILLAEFVEFVRLPSSFKCSNDIYNTKGHKVYRNWGRTRTGRVYKHGILVDNELLTT